MSFVIEKRLAFEILYFLRVNQFKKIKMIYEKFLFIYFLIEINEVNISEDLRENNSNWNWLGI